jgi:hypothetical protein
MNISPGIYIFDEYTKKSYNMSEYAIDDLASLWQAFLYKRGIITEQHLMMKKII